MLRDLTLLYQPRKDHYRYLAPFYERLVRLVFGTALHQAHHEALLLGLPVACDNTLHIWIGGGTGYSINEVMRNLPKTKLLYIEASQSMMKQAQQRLLPEYENRVQWLNTTHDVLYSSEMSSYLNNFNRLYLMSFFFMDVLKEDDCRILMRWAKQHQILGWFFADFVQQKKWHYQGLIRFMYLCFTLTTGISQRTLLDLKSIYLEEGWWPRGQKKVQAKGLVESYYFEPNLTTE